MHVFVVETFTCGNLFFPQSNLNKQLCAVALDSYEMIESKSESKFTLT